VLENKQTKNTGIKIKYIHNMRLYNLNIYDKTKSTLHTEKPTLKALTRILFKFFTLDK